MPRRRRRRRAIRNPSTTALILTIGGVAVLGAAGALLWVSMRPKQLDQVTSGELPEGTWIDPTDGVVVEQDETIDASGGSVVEQTICVGPNGGPPCVRTKKASGGGSTSKPKAKKGGKSQPVRVWGPPPAPSIPAPEPSPWPTSTGKPAGGGEAQPWVPGPGKDIIVRLPKPQTLKGWQFYRSFGPYRGQSYSVYIEHGIKGYRWAITGIGPSAGASAEFWIGTKKTARRRAKEYLRIGFGQGRAGVDMDLIGRISTGTVLFPDTWIKVRA